MANSLEERKEEFRISFRSILNDSKFESDFITEINRLYPGNLWVINVDWNKTGKLSSGKIFLVTRNNENKTHTCCIEF